ncbi:MAG: hypothetical protein GY851_16800 [bacterium]|nr:hypothetical protein [bacterium]
MAERKNPEGTWVVNMADTAKDGKALQATFTFNGDGTVTCDFTVGFAFTGNYDMTFEVDGNEVHIFAGSITIITSTIAWDMSLIFEDNDTMIGNAVVSVTWPGGSFSGNFTMNMTRQEPVPAL